MTNRKVNNSIDQKRWRTVVSRETGDFVYAVRTTGIFCQPGCSSRRPLRRNVLFFEDAISAIADGFRPCRRCQPNNSPQSNESADLVARACRLLRDESDQPTITQVADRLGISRSRLQRLFQTVLSVSPKRFANHLRTQRARDLLSNGTSITKAIYESGYSAPSRFYENASRSLGMSPSAYRSGGKGELIRVSVARCELGKVLVACSAQGVCAVTIGDTKKALLDAIKKQFPAARIEVADSELHDQISAVVRCIESGGSDVGLPLDIRGTAFQCRVWAALREIDCGSTRSYGELARTIGQPSAARAVAGACAANRHAVLIPCHRVVRGDGELGGYRWGVRRKQALLDIENTKRE